MSAARPFVSVLTPTYNRRQFIPAAIACFKAQTYPHDRMEWIVLDDGTDKVGDLFAASGLKNVRYVALPDGDKLPIGAKRNMINKLAKGDICVCWDDDDYYVPDRVRIAVMRLQGQKMAPVAGSTEVYMYFPDSDEIWSAGPYNQNHATNGTMAYWRSYAKTHHYDDTALKAEERQFMDDWKTPVAQLRPEQVMLVINHGVNTYDKRRLIYNKTNKAVKKTSLKLKSFIKDKKLREFYVGLRAGIKPYVHDETAGTEPAAAAAAGGAGGPSTATAAAATTDDIPSLEIDSSLSLSERLWSERLWSMESTPQIPTPPSQEAAVPSAQPSTSVPDHPHPAESAPPVSSSQVPAPE
jgi:glycosyltransferase involved in cell wall biosynthesis